VLVENSFHSNLTVISKTTSFAEISGKVKSEKIKRNKSVEEAKSKSNKVQPEERKSSFRTEVKPKARKCS
jgi:hypothetical protein